MPLDSNQIAVLNQILGGPSMRTAVDAARQASAVLQTDETDVQRLTDVLDGVPLISQQLVPDRSRETAVGGIRLSRGLPNSLLPAGIFGVFARATEGGITQAVLRNERGEEFGEGIVADLVLSDTPIPRHSIVIAHESVSFEYPTDGGHASFTLRFGADALISAAERRNNEEVVASTAGRLGIGADRINVPLALRGVMAGAVVVGAPAALEPRSSPDGAPAPDEFVGVFEAFGDMTTTDAEQPVSIPRGDYAIYGRYTNQALLRSAAGQSYTVDAVLAPPGSPSIAFSCICVGRWRICC